MTHEAEIAIDKSYVTHNNGERFLSLHEVEFRTSLKRSTLYALPDFPRPVKITVRRSAWRASEVQAWIDSRIHAGDVA